MRGASSQSGRLDLLGRPMPKLDEDEEHGFQESVIPSVGKRTAREAHHRDPAAEGCRSGP